MLRRGWLRRLAHFSDEDLLIYADGEATPKATRAIEEHLKSCWGCRGRLHAIEEAVTGFVKVRAALLNTSAAAPPKNWREFELRLDEVAARGGKPPLFAWLSLRWALQAGAAAVAVAAVCLWLALPTRTVSAKEALTRASDAEANLLRRVSSPVVYQKVRLRRTALRASVEEATLEVWDDAAQGRIARRGEDRLWRELDRALEANHLNGKPLVSARTFSSWRSAVRVQDESTERAKSPSGAPALLVRTFASGPHRENEIVEGELLLGGADWLPITQTWHVQGQDQIWQYELQAVEQSVVARNTVDVPALAAIPSLPKPAVPLLPPATPALPVSAGDPDLIELEARYVLHRRGDCLTGLIQVQREAGNRIVVRGLAETAREKAELTGALPHSPLLAVQIKTVEELETAAPSASQPGPAPETQAAARREIPVADLLGRRLAERYGAESVPRRITELANEAVGLSRSMRMQAWALRRLAERYGSGAAAPPAQSARWMLEAMLREHLLRLRADTTRAIAVFEPVWGDSALRPPALPATTSGLSASPWRECLELAQTVDEIDTLIQDLFTASGHDEPDTVDPKIRRLQAAFASLGNGNRNLEAKLSSWTATGDKQ